MTEKERQERKGKEESSNGQAPLRVRSDPLELRIRVLIQILGWIWAFSSNWAHLKFVVLRDDVTLFVCVCVHICGKQKREKKMLTAITWYSECIAAGGSHYESS